MKTKLIRAASVLCALVAVVAVVIASVPVSMAEPSKDSTVQKYEDELKYLEQRQEEVLGYLNANQNNIYEQQVYQQQLQNLISTVQSKIKVATNLIEALKDSRAELETQIAELEVEIDETFEEFLERIRISYEEGSVTYIGMLLGADSLRDFLSRVDHISNMLEYNKNLVKSYEAKKLELEQKKEDVITSIELQDSAIKELEATLTENIELLNNAELYLAQLQNNQNYFQNQLDEYNKAWEEANNKLTKYLEALAQQSQSQYNKEGFVWPMDINKNYFVTSGYGWRYIFGTEDFHLGIDIWGYTCQGETIHASSSGKVIIADANGYSSYGKYVVIDHGSGITTLYAHCDSVKVQVGQTVSKGEVIGICGSTGQVTGAHLHFEFRINGQTKNPVDYINLPNNLVNISGKDLWNEGW